MKLLFTVTLMISSHILFGQNFHTEYTYDDSLNAGITIQNSYPRGGLKYQAPDGKEYVYAVFWTTINNQTDAELSLSITFPKEPFSIPSSPGVKFNLYLPADTMTKEKESQFNYGLDLKAFLDKNFDKVPELTRKIGTKKTLGFYVVVLSTKGVDGVIRTGFALQNDQLIHTLNSHKMIAGSLVRIK